MEEYSEAKIYKSKPEPRNSNVNADFLLISGNIGISCLMQRVCLQETMDKSACKSKWFELPALNTRCNTIVLLKISLCA